MKKLTQSDLEYWGDTGCPLQPSGMRVIFWIIVAIAIVLLLALGMRSACARPFVLTFTDSTTDTNGQVTGYNICISTTNNGSREAIGWVNAGVTNFPFDTTNLPLPNPILFFGNTVGSNGQVSAYSAPFLFDTNNYPLPSPPVVLNLTPMTGFNIRTN